MAGTNVYEFDHNGVLYPDVTLDDIRLLLEEQAQGIITHPWDELRLRVGKHGATRLEIQLLYGVKEGDDKIRNQYMLVRVDTKTAVDEFDILAPFEANPKRPAQLSKKRVDAKAGAK